MRETAYLADRVFEIIQKETAFPKRSRWLFAKQIADLMNEILITMEEANKPEAQTEALRIRRYELQQIVLGKLSALDRIFTQAMRSIPIDPDKLDAVGGHINECERLIKAWIKSDEKRYGAVKRSE